MRRIVLAAAAESDWFVNHCIKGRGALRDRRGIDVNFERTAGLPHGLRCAIEFRFVKIIASHHGFDFASRIVDGEQRRLYRGVLLELYLDRGAGHFLYGNNDEVSNRKQVPRNFAYVQLKSAGVSIARYAQF